MHVRMVDLQRLHAPIRAEIDAAIGRVLDSGRFILGEEVERFEREIASELGVARCIGVSSGSDALLAALWAEGIGAGDEVVVPALSFVATAEAVVRAGATPVFADIGDDGNLDPTSAASRVTKKTRAILAVDLFGRRADVAALDGAPVIVDAAQSIGFGIARGARAATVSFFPTKNLGALGDGGLVATDDDALADRVRAVRVHGSTRKYVHERVGWNMRLDALQAAVLRAKLPHLGAWNDARRRVAASYRAALADVRELALPADAPDHVWHQFVVRAPEEKRDALRRHLEARGVESETYYPVALHLQPCFAEHRARAGDLPRAEAWTRTALALPIHPSLEPDELAHVVANVRSFFG